jgi:predicted O-methyltransferase YrrM
MTDDAAWNDFLAWLRQADQLEDPAEVFRAYGAALQQRGAGDAKAALGIVLRLMRERPDAWPLMFDKIYRSAAPRVTPAPNALLLAAIDGRPPGRALEVAMGQGRNAVALARAGWDVTGFDVSAEGLAVAAEEAAQAGVALRTRQTTHLAFDYGEAAWDLIAVIYGPGAIAQPDYARRLIAALRRGGLVVVESFASPAAAPNRRPVDIDPADLLAAFAGCRLRRFEDTDGVTDWTPQTTSLVRLIAERRG